MDKEQEIYKQIQALDSEMQTLVYENYNKFISATDTIRKVNIGTNAIGLSTSFSWAFCGMVYDVV